MCMTYDYPKMFGARETSFVQRLRGSLYGKGTPGIATIPAMRNNS